jgi:putative endonuclease
MHFVYILYSLKDYRLYKGATSNLQKRLIKHNSGGSTSTAKRKPFVLVHVEQFEGRVLFNYYTVKTEKDKNECEND